MKIFLSKILKKSQKNVRNRIQFQSLYTVVCSQCPPEIHLFKVNNGSTKTMCENSSKLTIKRHQSNITDIGLMYLLITLNIFHQSLWCFFFFDFEQMSAKYGVRLLAHLHTVRRPVLTFNFPKTETHKSLIS